MSIFFCFFIYKHIYQYKCHLLFYNINIFSFMLIAKTVRDNFNSLNFIRVSPPVSITPPLSLYSIVNNVVCGFQLPKKKKTTRKQKIPGRFRGHMTRRPSFLLLYRQRRNKSHFISPICGFIFISECFHCVVRDVSFSISLVRFSYRRGGEKVF